MPRIIPVTLVLIALALPAHAVIPATERAALEAIYNTTNGANWNAKENWLGAAGSECTWRGITCNNDQTAVIGIELSWNNLAGTIPQQIGNFSQLRELRLTGNAIGGTIPDAITQLRNLEVLEISYTEMLSGPIPPGLSQLTRLRELRLYLNRLTGRIPDLGQAPELAVLDLSANNLDGPIPSSTGSLINLTHLILEGNALSGEIGSLLTRLTKLEKLNLEGNQLTGPIPTQLDHMPNLNELTFYDNQLTGEFPTQVTRLTKLERLRLGVNQLTGRIPAEINTLTQLKHLALNGNELDGPIPGSIGLLPVLEELSLGSNQLSGKIPPELGQLAALEYLNLANNQLVDTIPVELANLTALKDLSLYHNKLSGEIPRQLGNLSNLVALDFGSNELSGEIPPDLGKLSKIVWFYLGINRLRGRIPTELEGLKSVKYMRLGYNQLQGEIPAALGSLPELRSLELSSNLLSGPIPDSLAQQKKLEFLILGGNQLSGLIPTWISQLTALEELSLNDNNFIGEIPDLSQLSRLIDLNLTGNRLFGPLRVNGLTNLESLQVDRNELSGQIPADIDTLAKLEVLDLAENNFDGEIPATLGSLQNLQRLHLQGNRLRGAIPASLGSLSRLTNLELQRNALRGQIPSTLMGLTSLNYLDLRRNALTTSDPALRTFLDSKQAGRNWIDYQTLPPTNVSASATASALTVSWTPIAFDSDSGGYQISARFSPTEPYSTLLTTANKIVSAATVSVVPGRSYSVVVTTVTYATGSQKNTIVSDPSPEVGVTTPPAGPPGPPIVAAFTLPNGIVQIAGTGGGTDSYSLTNVGETATTITLEKEGTFFTQEPSSFSLAPGATQEITLTGLPQAAEAYLGASLPRGTGVPSGLSIAVRLLSTPPPPPGSAVAQPSVNRIDVAAPTGQNPTNPGAGFSNVGTATVSGILVSDQPWLIPQSGIITIEPGRTVTVAFEIKRELRPDQEGTAIAKLTLVYVSGTNVNSLLARPFQGAPGTVNSVVTVVDTAAPGAIPSAVPRLEPGEVALFIPGAGNVTGGGGAKFLTDIAITNLLGINPVDDVKVYYTSAMGAASPATSVASIQALSPTKAVSFADVTKGVFSRSEELGTLQVRSRSWDKLQVSANIFNVASSAGTYGNNIPVFRSDRSIAQGSTLTITGLRKDAASRTNLFVQETTGQTARYQIEFSDTTGQVVPSAEGATMTRDIEPFRLQPLLNVVPAGAVIAKITNVAGPGRIVAYATPVDGRSADSWSLVDWNRYFATDPADITIVPVAGRLAGGSGAFFRTDLAISNISTEPARGVLRYYPSNGGPQQRDLDLPPGTSQIASDVVTSWFPAAGDSAGHLVLTPRSGRFVVASRTFSTVGSDPGTFGMGVPTLSLGFALRAGQTRLISGLELSRPGGKPGTFRTNIGLLETSGEAATVQVTIRFAVSTGLTSLAANESFDYELAPNQFVLASDLSNRIAGRRPIGDLRDVQIEFKVIRGTGAVAVFTASVDNGTTDQVLRVE